MSNTPGVVVVNTFCPPDEKYFSGYIRYMDRPGAVKKKHLKEFDIFAGYMDYMGNPLKTEEMNYAEPEKISGLFTNNSNLADEEEVAQLKTEFKTAQDNGSLLWQTVLSFDNEWLQSVNIYDVETGQLDEKRLKNAARCAINEMLEKEELSNGVWTAAIHYNTDNIHVHVGTVEPYPERRKKLYAQYEKTQIDGKWQYAKRENPETGQMERIPILDENGNIKMEEEYVGKFKESSLRAAKRAVVRELDQDKTVNKEINQLIRQRILERMKDTSLYDDAAFREGFINLCRSLPDNLGICNYKNNAMKPLRSEIDQLSLMYIEKYHKDDYAELIEKLYERENYYKRAYGGEDNSYMEDKLQDLMYRMGNQILTQAKTYLKEQRNLPAEREIEPELDFVPDADDIPEPEQEPEFSEENFPEQLEEIDLADKTLTINAADYYIDWKDGYSNVMKLIYKSKDYKRAFQGLSRLADKGNVLAICEIGNMYHFGRGIEADEEIAQEYYKHSLEGFTTLLESNLKYCSYRIGKQYLYGQGTPVDAETAAEFLQTAADEGHSYAQYLMGNLYLQGKGVERDIDAALSYYRASAAQENPYAQYKLGQIYAQGEVTEKNAEMSYANYKSALEIFESLEDKDDNMLYRIGTMYLNGKGTAIDYTKAEEYLEEAADLNNILAIYQLGKHYLSENNPSRNIEKGLAYLQRAAEEGNVYAVYQLGQIYERGEIVEADPEETYSYYKKALAEYLESDDKDAALYYRIATMYKNGQGTERSYQEAIKYYQKAAEQDNALAMYQLGKIYLHGVSGENIEKDTEQSLRYFALAAERDNPYAQYQLGSIYERGEITESDTERSYDNYKKALENFLQVEPKDEITCYRIGIMYLKGKGTTIDYEKAGEYLEKAAENDNLFALYQLGQLYLHQDNPYRDVEKGITYLKKAEKGNAYAAYQLGQIYERGEIVEADLEEAYSHYKKALAQYLEVEDKDAWLHYQIAKMYEKGQGTDINYEAAIDYYEKAADQDHILAMYQLGKIYLNGIPEKGIEKNITKALLYLKRAADEGNPYAQYDLGSIYEKGEVTTANLARSSEYYAKALEQFLQMENKDAFICYRIGSMYLRGRGTEMDYEKAIAYLEESAEKGNPYAAETLNYLNQKSALGRRSGYHKQNADLKSALIWLQRTLHREHERYNNLREYERLQQAIQSNGEIEME
ncbi:MobP2 family relaxase [Emergencia sp. 1XD21-10]|uniref:MobP2 family relaxase n=1 Tax=Emergencia sp. 1XD21-10 TaxID=2304569 RepID=UPI00137AEAAD|nr:MobP2 family relaxase [Emergencia sp. 1XD21-10]NCE98095.1 sel1 repeat family protein [Emergencia sp. 1XD21-10]